jgi:uncharacterized protein (DUF2252 family)
MARSAHAYMRGSTVKFYEWLGNGGHQLPEGPAVWICGDCHLGNLGPLADLKGRVRVQIRDLDQTVIGNPAHDLIRLALSLASAARGSDLPGVITAHMIEEFAHGYENALSHPLERLEDSHRPKAIRRLLARSVRRRWRHLAEERIEDAKPEIPLGRRFLPLEREERKALEELVAAHDVQALLRSLHARPTNEPCTFVDAAYWVKGCSSLGRLRYAVLVKTGARKQYRYALLDVKECVEPSAPRAPGKRMPTDNAERVVAGARALSPHLGDRMTAARLIERSVAVRELMPQDLKLDLRRLRSADASQLAHYLASVLGQAHGRQMARADRKAWLKALENSHSKSLDAPGWLWSAVVELMATHEAAYLHHCWRHALGNAA